MWTVERPDFDIGKVFDECTKIIRNAALRNQMTDIRPNILALSDDFDARAQADEIHLLAQHQAGVGAVSGDDLKKNYTQRMAVKGKPARSIYDAILSLPKNNRCPFCNYGPVEDLDHYLPKSLYPGISVKPENLVGCCKRCNKLKDNISPTSPNDGFLHPYFNTANNAVWLMARVHESAPASITFHTAASAELSPALNNRIAHQFSVLKLGQLYSDVAADEIADNMDVLDDVYHDGASHSVAAHLARQARSCRSANMNSWRAAMYDALAESDWYCNGGFRGEG